MNAADKQIADILAAHGEDFQANTWIVPGGKARAIHHHCTERMAAKEGIKFDQPRIISAELDNVVIFVVGRDQHGTEVWSFGEAAPKNNKNAYPFSMAEKRAKDRVALKLLKLHGLVYSEAEADEFRPPEPSKPTEKVTTGRATVDAFGLPSLESLTPPAEAKRLQDAAAKARGYVSLAKTAMQNSESKEEIDAWWLAEAANRAKHGVTKGTPEYEDLAAAFRETKGGLPYADVRAAG